MAGSKFYENERLKEEQMKRRIEEQKEKIERITEQQLKAGVIEVTFCSVFYFLMTVSAK